MTFSSALIAACRGSKIGGPGWNEGEYFMVNQMTGMLWYYSGSRYEKVEASTILCWTMHTDWEIIQ